LLGQRIKNNLFFIRSPNIFLYITVSTVKIG